MGCAGGVVLGLGDPAPASVRLARRSRDARKFMIALGRRGVASAGPDRVEKHFSETAGQCPAPFAEALCWDRLTPGPCADA